MEKIKDFLNNTWGRLKTWHKYAIGFIIFVAIAAFSLISTLPDGYTKIYGNLSETDHQEILTELSKMGVDYKIGAANEISVKTQDVPWVRTQMTDLGLPSNGQLGYDLFLENSLGATQKDKELKELTARKGQLEMELVRSFKFIDAATVNLTMPPKASIFEPEEGKGSASVLLTLKSGTQIDEQQMAGIQHMVSSAIPGVKPEDVTIIDSKIGILSGSDSQVGNISGAYEKQMQIKKQTEDNINQDIKRSLSSLFGYENVQINVNVSINFDEIVRNIEKYDDKGVLRSSSSDKEVTQKLDGATTPEAGTDSNGEVPNYNVGDEAKGAEYEQNKEKMIENFEIGKTVETIKKNPELTNTNIVVWLNQKFLNNADVNELRNAIGIAAGLQTNEDGTFRNGQVSVMALDFVDNANNVEEPTEEATGIELIIQKYMLFIIIGLAALFVLLIVIIAFLAKKKKKRRAEMVTSSVSSDYLVSSPVESDEDVTGGRKQLTLQDGIDDEQDEYETPELREIRKRTEKRHKDMEQSFLALSNEHPRETAEYIKKLLKGRK